MLVLFIKKRDPKIHNEVKSFTVIGEVEDRHAILLDDIIDTGGTYCCCIKKLEKLFTQTKIDTK